MIGLTPSWRVSIETGSKFQSITVFAPTANNAFEQAQDWAKKNNLQHSIINPPRKL